MKYVLLITILFFISFSNSVSIKFNIDSNKDGEYNSNFLEKCNYSGFTVDYQSQTINAAVDFRSYVVPYTYYEFGQMVVDYEKEMVIFNFHNTAAGKLTSGICFDFYGNNTQYVYTNQTGEELCFITTTQVNSIPKVSNSKLVGTTKVGSSKCNIYENPYGIFNHTKQVSIYDTEDCSLVNIVFENNYVYPGKSIWTFNNFVPEVDHSKIQVPSVCFTNPVN